MYRILHITTHMGGGVGRALSGITCYASQIKSKYQHKILLLEKPEKVQFIDECKKHNVDVLLPYDYDNIVQEIKNADIIELEWWHHPKMAQFLHNFPQIPVRLIVWSHISGCNYPMLPFEFVNTPHRFIFTSKYSLENSSWTNEQRELIKNNADVVNSSGGFDHIKDINTSMHDGFNIGYVGTLSYNKLTPNFVDYSMRVNVPNAKFILVGDDENKSFIMEEAKRKGIHERFEFVGYTSDVFKELSRFDVFAYPLSPEHYGTTEIALLEAMAAGLPVVALNQCAEKYLIEHMQTGLLANNANEYSECIKYLYNNPDERLRIGRNAREKVLTEFAVSKTVEKLNCNYDKVLIMQKKCFRFDNVFGSKPYEWFLSCAGSDRKFFEDSINNQLDNNKYAKEEIVNKIRGCKMILKGKSKSSVYHFAKYFPDDEMLRFWKGILD
jgi:glycosyltransferase involved in cell wall biosynthesis